MIKTRYGNFLTLDEELMSVSKIANDLHKSDINFFFRNQAQIQSALSRWQLTLNNNYTLSDNPLKFTSAFGDVSQATLTSDIEYGANQYFHFVYNFEYKPTSALALNAFPASIISRDVSTTDYIFVEFVASDISGDKITVSANTPLGAISFEEPVTSRSLKIRISCVPGNYILGNDAYLFFAVWENGSWREFGDPLNPYIPWNPALSQKWYITMSETSGQSSEVSLGAAVFYPVITAPYTSYLTGFPSPERSNKDEVVYLAQGQYPGSFSGKIYGVGTNWGLSEDISVDVIDKYYADSQLCFVHSQISNFYTDLTQGLSCPDFSKDEETLGNLRAENVCFCDGSTPSTNKAFIETVKTGILPSPGNSDRYPEIILEDSSGNRFGQDFDFKSIYRTPYLESQEAGIKDLRCLVLANGNRLFYGSQNNELVDEQEIFIRWESSLNGSEGFQVPLLERWLEAENSDVQIDYQSYAAGTYNIATDSEIRYRLAPGRYSFKFNKGMDAFFVEDNLEVAVYSGTSDAGNKLVEWPKYRATYEASTNELKFELKQLRGNLYGFLHNICDGSITRFDGSGDEVNLLSNSIGAIQISDTQVALLFQWYSSGDLVDQRVNGIFYRVLDLNTMTLGSLGLINLPIIDTNGFQYVYCFDAFKDENGRIIFLAGFGQERLRDGNLIGSATNGGVNTSVPVFDYRNRFRAFQLTWEPYVLGGVYAFEAFVDDLTWDGSDINIKKALPNFKLSSIEQLAIAFKTYPYQVDSEDVPVYGEGNLGYAFAAPNQIRASYNSDFQRAIVSVIDHEHHLGDIFVGNGERWKEVCYPALFNQSWRAPFSHKYWAQLESLSACFGQDGKIYGVGTTRALEIQPLIGQDILPSAEMFVSDLSFLDSNLPAWVTYVRGEESYNNWSDLLAFEPKYRFQKYPILADTNAIEVMNFEKYNTGTLVYDAVGSKNRQSQILPLRADIILDKNNLVLTKQAPVGGHPLIYQNGESDVLPFSTYLEDTYKPGTSTVISGVNASGWSRTLVTDSGYRSSISNQPTPSSISKTLDSDKINSGKSVAGAVGYRFSARLMMGPNAPNSSFTNSSPTMTIRATTGVYGGSLDLTPPTYAEVEARFVFLGDEVEMEVWDAGLGNWTFVDSLVISNYDVYDFHIITRSAGFDGDNAIDNGQVVFIVKRWEQPTSTYDSDVVPYYEGHNTYIRTYDLNQVSLETAGVSEETFFDLRFVGEPTGDPLDRVYVYDLGWGIIKPNLDVLIPTNNAKDLGTFFDITPQGRSGKIWREFNDSYLFTSRLPEDSPFRVDIPSNTLLSPKIYFHNGFCFRMFGSKTFYGDTISINREYLNQIGNVISKNLHSNWGTQTDEVEVLIWADAQDSGLEKFDIDAVIIDGANFKDFEVVYKNEEADPWIVEGQYSCSVMQINNYTSDSFGNNNQTIYAEYANFGIDRFIDSDHYVYVDDATRPLKIDHTDGEKISCLSQSVSFIFAPYLEIFSSKIAKTTSLISARYVGIRILDQMTYEGRYVLRTLDFGRYSSIPHPCSPVDVKKLSNDLSSNLLFIVDESTLSKNYKNIARNYNIKYDLISNLSATRLESTLRMTASKKDGVWVLENKQNEPNKVFYTLLEGNPSRNVIVDENGEKHFEISANFRSVR